MGEIRVGLFGFGKTGKLVANEVMNEPGFKLEWVVRRHRSKEKYASKVLGYSFQAGELWGQDDIKEGFFQEHGVDVIIDFSAEKSVYVYAEAAQLGIPIVSAISNYEEQERAVLQSYAEKTAVLYSPNITVGINIVMVVAQILRKIVPHADVEILEEHFKGKQEVSGTAKKLADVLSLDYDAIHSIRMGKTVGRHKIIFGMPNQTIRLVHESVDRAAFGQGAIFAAKFLVKQSPGFYSMEQIVTAMFQKNIPVY